MEFCGETKCDCGPLPADSIDRKAALELSFWDLDLSGQECGDYFAGASVYMVTTVLDRYFHKSMGRQRNGDGSAKYRMPDPSLSTVTVKRGRSEIYPMQMFDEDEASISGTIAIPELISEELSLTAGEDAAGLDIRRKAIMYHGDYLTVRNIS